MKDENGRRDEDERLHALFSEYVDGTLPAERRAEVEAAIAGRPELARELGELSATVAFLREVGPEEPRLDLWTEFAPRHREELVAQRLPLPARLRRDWALLISAAAEGAILFIQVVGTRATRGLQRYVLNDPLSSEA